MPKSTDEKLSEVPTQSTFQRQSQKVSNFFTVPAPRPIKQLFSLFPLVTYAPNKLPQRSPGQTRIPSLYVFSTEEDAAAGRPSFNPSCLKWQTFLNIAGIDHHLVSSNNHASPTGSLPFLLPAAQSSNSSQELLAPIPTNKFIKYAAERGSKIDESDTMRYDAYQSLLDHRIRNAWLYTLYLSPANFSAVAHRLYIAPASSNPLVQLSISSALRAAATAELLKHTSTIDADDLYSEADKAFEALSILLGTSPWFFDSDEPSLFDASVFAYTQLLLDEGMGWVEKKLVTALRRRENLCKHRERLLVSYRGRWEN